MSYERPTLAELIERAQADIESRLPGTDAKLRRSNLNVLARVMSGGLHGLYGYLDWLSRQVLPDTADAEMLDRHATLWLPEGRIPAAFATGTAVATGVNGTVIPAGTIFKRADDVEYETDAEATVASGTATVALTAVEAGQAGNATASTALNLAQPIAGLNAEATAGALAGGADQESDESLRTRVLTRIRQTPHGGADFDYVSWALEVPGVTRAWVYPMELGPGTVTVRFVRDNDASIIPDAGEVATVQAYIDTLRPVTADVTVVAPIPDALDFTIQLTPNTLATRTAVEAELRDLIMRESEPGGTILLSHLREAISLAAGETDSVLMSPAANVAHALGHMAVFGAITWA